MKHIFLVALLAMAPLLQAANLTGEWVSGNRPNSQAPQTSLYLTQQGELLTGYMKSGDWELEITHGSVTSDRASFDVIHDDFGEERKVAYTATANGDELRLQFNGWNGTVRTIKLKRISSAAPPAMPTPAPKISLPAAPEVPSNGLARTPPMGWNSWNKFANKVTDKLIRETADAMASNGMKEAGYTYINIDDTWEGKRDPQGNIQTNEKFPDMKALADYVHSEGLKIGIYSSPGPKTCAGFEGSFQHEEQDAKTYAAWGFDYLKYDWCSASEVYDYHSMPAVYAKMGEALLHSGRPILFSLCQYGVFNGPQWGASVGGNSWRTTGDISDNWAVMSHIGFDLQMKFAQYANPGHWNDPDMLEVGNGGMTDVEYRTHMSLWCLLASPLLAGNDLRKVPPNIMEILTNKEVIAIDQDTLGKEATRVSKDGDLEVWARPLSDGGFAVGLFNRGAVSAKVTAHWKDIGVSGPARIRDLWAHADLSEANDHYSADVPSHGVVLLRLQPVK